MMIHDVAPFTAYAIRLTRTRSTVRGEELQVRALLSKHQGWPECTGLSAYTSGRLRRRRGAPAADGVCARRSLSACLPLISAYSCLVSAALRSACCRIACCACSTIGAARQGLGLGLGLVRVRWPAAPAGRRCPAAPPRTRRAASAARTGRPPPADAARRCVRASAAAREAAAPACARRLHAPSRAPSCARRCAGSQ
eukprot:scaffold42295_cov60-Phaeocystis_antarctica.AAC.2